MIDLNLIITSVKLRPHNLRLRLTQSALSWVAVKKNRLTGS